MNIGVEIALIAALGGIGAKLIDLEVRKRVDKAETLARADRIAKEVTDRTDKLTKEQLDREQVSDLAIITHVPAWLEIEDIATERELLHEKEHICILEKENAALEERIRNLSWFFFLVCRLHEKEPNL